MSYTPTNWQTGDIVTAERLNKMEQGIKENAGYWIPLQFSNGTFSVPVDKVDEVLYALQNPDNVFINGAAIGDLAFYGGYRVNENEFYCPLSAEVMEANGMSGTGNIIIKHAVGVADVSVEVVPDTFIVTLTPTAQDFSGTMDKTVGEIKTAYKAGKQIVFRVLSSETRYTDIYSVSFDYDTSDDVLIFYANIFVLDSGAFVIAYNVQLGDSTDVYSTTIFPLTPMS